MRMVILVLASSIAVFRATTVLEKVLNTADVDVSFCNYCDIPVLFECTALPSPPRNVTAQPSQTFLLIEWLEPEQVFGEFYFYYVVCGTQTGIIFSITETAINVTELSVFTRYECCVRVFNYNFIDSIPNCVNATTAPVINEYNNYI